MNRFGFFLGISFLAASGVFTTFGLFAQDIRASVKGIVTIDPREPEGSSVSLAYDEAIAVLLPESSQFIQGVEIEIRLPKAVSGSESAFGWTLYRSVRPLPAAAQYDYQAEAVLTQTFPGRVSVVYQIPVSERHSLRTGPYATVIPMLCPPQSFPLLLRLSSFSKGVSKAMESAQFKITVRPVLTDEGAIGFSISFPEGFERSRYSVSVDDKRVEDPTESFLLKKGQHQVLVHADGFREEVRVVTVEAGRVLVISLAMEPDKPVLVFEAPVNAHISLDGQIVSLGPDNSLSVEPGEHTVVCKIGDYTITKKILASRGKIYHIVLAVELRVQESP